jgi:hypothetical protein
MGAHDNPGPRPLQSDRCGLGSDEAPAGDVGSDPGSDVEHVFPGDGPVLRASTMVLGVV